MSTREFSGRPYTLPGVEVVIDEARSRLHRCRERFGIVQLSLIDTFSLNAAGGLVFSENYLYTKRGVPRVLPPPQATTASSSSPATYVPEYPLEILRLAGMARAAWEAEGVARPADCVVILGQGMNSTVLAKRTPFTADELAQLERSPRDERHGRALSPRPRRPGDARSAPCSPPTTSTRFVDAYPFLIGPPTDDRPSSSTSCAVAWRRPIFPTCRRSVPVPAAVARVVSLMYLLSPWSRRWPSSSSSARCCSPAAARAPAGAWRGPVLLYFACLGYGFMMIEIPLLQRSCCFLGYPVYALAVVLFALLLFSGIGSLLTSRAPAPRAALVRCWAHRPCRPATSSSCRGDRRLLGSRSGCASDDVLLLAPIGLVLGWRSRSVSPSCAGSEELVPWAWGMNGAMSVVASVLAIFIGSRFGFSSAFVTGLVAYGVGLLVMVVLPRVAAAPVRSLDNFSAEARRRGEVQPS